VPGTRAWTAEKETGRREYSPTESPTSQLAIEHSTPENRLTAPDFNIPRLTPIFRTCQAIDRTG
jgi:hypothetical protein